MPNFVTVTGTPSEKTSEFQSVVRPGAAAAVLRRIAEAGANVDLLYLTLGGHLVVGGEGLDRIGAGSR